MQDKSTVPTQIFCLFCFCLFDKNWLTSAVDKSSEFLQPNADGAVASDTNSSQRLVIWGTDVNVGTCKEKFQVRDLPCRSFTCFPQRERLHFYVVHFGLLRLQRFLQRFIDPSSNEDENAGLDLNEPLYMQKLEEVRRSRSFLFHQQGVN